MARQMVIEPLAVAAQSRALGRAATKGIAEGGPFELRLQSIPSP